jgi:hypothetical protein
MGLQCYPAAPLTPLSSTAKRRSLLSSKKKQVFNKQIITINNTLENYQSIINSIPENA